MQTLGTTQEDAAAQQAAGNVLHQSMIEGLVAEGKYLWQAFQAGNDVGHNNNNNTVGGLAHDAVYCTQWMTQRCNTDWVNERATTGQFDSRNVNVSIASFLIVRPAYAWLGYGAGYRGRAAQHVGDSPETHQVRVCFFTLKPFLTSGWALKRWPCSSPQSAHSSPFHPG